MNREFAEDVYIELSRSNLPESLNIGGEYHFVIVGEVEVPLGKRTILHLESGMPEKGRPEAIVRFTSYQFGKNKSTEERVTRVGIKLEEFIQ